MSLWTIQTAPTLCLLLLILPGCDRREEKLPSQEVERSVAAPKVERAEAKPRPQKASTHKGGGTGVRVLETGDPERHELRYSFVQKPPRQIKLELEVVASASMNGEDMRKVAPVLLTLEAQQSARKLEEGKAFRDTLFQNIKSAHDEKVLPQEAQGVASKAVQLISTNHGEEIDARGRILSTKAAPAKADASMNGLLEHFKEALSFSLIELPEEKVGAGAVWEIKNDVEAGGITFVETRKVQLVEMNGEVATVDITVTQSAGSQALDQPGLPPGIEMELVSLEGSGQGRLSVNLADAFASGEVALSSTLETRLSGAGIPGAMLSSAGTSLKIKISSTK